MKKQTQTNLLFCSGIALALALALWSPVQARAAEPAAEKMMKGDKMMDCCQAVKEQQQKMFADMKAEDAELTTQIAQMNSAPKDKKVDLLAAIVTRMLEQRVAATNRMVKMHEAMEKHMMQHKHMDKDSMSHRPDMKCMDDKTPDVPTAQK